MSDREVRRRARLLRRLQAYGRRRAGLDEKDVVAAVHRVRAKRI